jgi:hypothetical protein
LPRAVALSIALMLAIPAPTTASAGTDSRFCLLGLSVIGTGIELFCSKPRRPAVIDTACQGFAPLRWSRRDTPQTIAQAKAHNAAWLELCGPSNAHAGKP